MSDEMWQQLLSGQLHSLKMLTLQDFPVSENELPSLMEIHIPSPFDLNSINWKCRSLKPVQKNYIIEVELCGSRGKLRLPEDADKLLHGDNEWANKLNMAANKISSMRRRKPVDRKLKQETEMSVENLEEEKKSK
ncbi:hypothetical protein Patl1_22358 [Pistacia atlantica]|uniref:Uncharacterized protein n=1 Tax=Pistacia atlantica TaxID=434234 RepID=A0ACC1A2N8_9ROSI|nr:hypothetical protein Patl1_22358 [Pistacia atlantica]